MKVNAKSVSNPTITPANTNSIGNANSVKGKGSEAAEAFNNTSKADLFSSSKVNLSARARDAQKIRDVAMSTPDVDQEKVAKFKAMIERGEYKVDPEALADRIVQDELKWSAETEA